MNDPRTCALCSDAIDLDERRSLRVRHSEGADATAIEDLYRRLRPEDIRRRFFTGSLPPRAFFERWATIGEADEDGNTRGFGIVAELSDPDGVHLVGEAGYTMLANGDAELGIAIDPSSRGWLGPWLLDSLLRHGAARDVSNLEALVLCDNRAMLSLIRHRGYAVLDHPDWGTIRLTVSTNGHTPAWPPERGGPRVLIGSRSSRWIGEEAFRQKGFEVAVCPGVGGDERHCPVRQGSPCPLVDGADAVVVDLPSDDPRAEPLRQTLPTIHPGIRLVEAYEPTGHNGDDPPKRRSNDALLAELTDLIVRPGMKKKGSPHD